MSFYSADEIDRLLICSKCENKYDDPRTLPCGKSFCNSCIKDLADTKREYINCLTCGKRHDIPIDDGFPPNLDMAQLISIKADEVTRSEVVEEFKLVTALIKENSDKLKLNLQIGETTIRNHCDKVRDEVQLFILESQEKLNKILSQFLDEIDAYEKMCQSKFKQLNQNKSVIENALIESNEFRLKSNETLQQHKIDEMDLKVKLKEADLLLNKINKIADQLQSDMFNKKTIKFVKQEEIEAAQIGQVKFSNPELHFLANLTNCDQLDFGLVATDICPKTRIWILPFMNKGFICAYLNKSNKVNLLKLDKNGIILIEKKNVTEVIQDGFTVTANNNSVCLEEIECDIESVVLCFDENLNKIEEIYIEEVSEVICNSSETFSYFSYEDYFLTIYKTDFKVLKHVDIGKLKIFRYTSYSGDRFLINDKSILYQDFVNNSEDLDDHKSYDYNFKEIKIINKETENIEKIFTVNKFDSWLSYLNKYLVTFERDSLKLRTYDFNGVLVSENLLNKSFGNSTLSFTFDKKLCFKKNKKILFM
jgi:hypothetical protein